MVFASRRPPSGNGLEFSANSLSCVRFTHVFFPEKIIEFLRVNSSPIVLANIFLCFRVLILRMSSNQLTSLWPFIYTELVSLLCRSLAACPALQQAPICHLTDSLSPQSQIFLQIENELQRTNPANESFFLANNGSTNNPGYLQMYLQACKFLDLAISLPADSLPQFQLGKFRTSRCSRSKVSSTRFPFKAAANAPLPSPDRWSFISSVNSEHHLGDEQSSQFEPQILRIEKLMRRTVRRSSPLGFEKAFGQRLSSPKLSHYCCLPTARTRTRNCCLTSEDRRF